MSFLRLTRMADLRAAVRSRLHTASIKPWLQARAPNLSFKSFSSGVASTGSSLSVSVADKRVGYWLLGCCGTVVVTVVVGGVTRLTESGLSIVEWNPLTGVKSPSTQDEWKREYELYKLYPEYKYNKISLEDFKRIWYMEYAHRILGRTVGVVFAVPALVFWAKGYFRPNVKRAVVAFATLIGFQGALGWYMVKSGLEHDPQGAHAPRVSQYRLMAHLGSAFLLYAGMFTVALKHLIPSPSSPITIPGRLRGIATGLSHLVFLTAMSGALVAGLDAGLGYNSFPKMGEYWVPPEYLQMQPVWKNFLENATTVQFNHRVLGITTFSLAMGLWFVARGVPLPSRARLAVNGVALAAITQVTLGISTLLYFVPTELAASHQAGSLALLSMAIWFVQELKRLAK